MGSPSADPLLERIVQSYDDSIVRAYCTIRFMILRQRFLLEIGQYMPRTGRVLDIGCGFGLFALYFASQAPTIQIQGFDLNARRVRMAERAAARLGVQNVCFHVADAAAFDFDEPVAAAYVMDLIHHIPERSVGPLLETIARNLAPDGCLLIKDIDPTAVYKRAFAWLLDKRMDYNTPVHYWRSREVHQLMRSLGFRVRQHSMHDYLPYPHVLYINTKDSASKDRG